MEIKVPLETKVRYHGSIDYMHGEYVVVGYSKVEERRDLTPEQAAEAYPMGLAYELWPADLPRKFGFRERGLYFVRRTSFTVLETPE